jgi:CubicO group peptidase (beta-lactamase class C family)
MAEQLILADGYTSIRNRVMPVVNRLLKAVPQIGMNLALLDGEEVVWAESMGIADDEPRRQVDLDTLFKAGSVTKVVTALAVLRCVERGLLQLDQPVHDLLPEFKPQYFTSPGRGITLRDLMTHHAGLPCDYRKDFYAESFEQDPAPLHSVLPFLNGHHLPYPPGHILSYSNLGMDLVGLILEGVTGKTYASVIQDEVLDPLGMNLSSIQMPANAAERLSKGFTGVNSAWEPQLRDLPAGGLYTSILDLLKVGGVIMNEGRVNDETYLKPETVAEMIRPQNAGNPLDFGLDIGLNWFVSYPKLNYAGKVCWHDGGTIHFSSILICLPEHKLTAAILMNSFSSLAVHTVGPQILQAVLSKHGIEPEPVRKKAVFQSQAGALMPFDGLYPTISLGPVRLASTPQKSELTYRDTKFQLVPTSLPGWYGMQLRLFGLVPVPIKEIRKLRVNFSRIDGEDVLALENDGMRQAIATRWSPEPVPESWQARCGLYRNTNEKDEDLAEIRLMVIDGNQLVLETSMRKMGSLKVILIPRGDRQAISGGLGRFGGEELTVIDTPEGECLELWGLIFRKVVE